MKYFTRIAVIAALISTPSFASAATAAELQAQAQALLLQVAALQAQLGGQSTTPVTTVTSSANCPLIGRVLKRGSSGDDVTRLQRFLAVDPSIYPEGQITGYYGALTEAAVMRWQVRYNIVSSGTAETTGYGVTGPRTAAAISLQCSTASTTGGSGTYPAGSAAGPVGGFIQVSPVTGNAPLSVKVQANVNTAASCSGALYTLEWGDGTAPNTVNVPPGNCGQVVQYFTHLYLYGGTYIVKLSAGAHQTTATVVVSGAGAPAAVSVNETFTASATSGQAPFSVRFGGVVSGSDHGWCAGGCSSLLEFGDGATSLIALPFSSNGSQAYSVEHTYTNAGTFTAVLHQGQNPASPWKVGSPIAITVTANPANYAYGPLAVTPNVSGNPLSASVSFDLPTTCTGYSLSWGDGTSDIVQSHATSCAQAASTKSFTHQYAAAGSYTIALGRGASLSQQDSLSIVISN